eukprot:scaffold1911_cov397-Prasinococcus_capsulatus_cf.AAC.19
MECGATRTPPIYHPVSVRSLCILLQLHVQVRGFLALSPRVGPPRRILWRRVPRPQRKWIRTRVHARGAIPIRAPRPEYRYYRTY